MVGFFLFNVYFLGSILWNSSRINASNTLNGMTNLFHAFTFFHSIVGHKKSWLDYLSVVPPYCNLLKLSNLLQEMNTKGVSKDELFG